MPENTGQNTFNVFTILPNLSYTLNCFRDSEWHKFHFISLIQNVYSRILPSIHCYLVIKTDRKSSTNYLPVQSMLKYQNKVCFFKYLYRK